MRDKWQSYSKSIPVELKTISNRAFAVRVAI
jgi:hypothetical protein